MNVDLTIRNVSPGPRIIHDAEFREVRLDPGKERRVIVARDVAESLRRRADLTIVDEGEVMLPALDASASSVSVRRAPLFLKGMQGLGDNIHQRAIVRELMKTRDVTLATCHGMLYQDLVRQGLKLNFLRSHLRTQAKTQARERQMLDAPVPPRAETRHISYGKPTIDRLGSVLASMFASVGLTMPEWPDYSLHVPYAWRMAARVKIGCGSEMPAKPIMVHRPVTLRKEWDSSSRNPDLEAYDAIFRSIRDQFFVVSVADIDGAEWLVGPQQDVDIALHRGELDFAGLAGLYAEAALVFSGAGFSPILAQAVGTPVCVVYGGYERYGTIARTGAHLAPTLGIDPDRPCDCYSHHHRCDKRISLGPAVERLADFIKTAKKPDRAPPAALEVQQVATQPAPQKTNGRPSYWRGGASSRAAVSAGGNARVALVAGGASSVMDELEEALALCAEAGESPIIIAVNDTIPLVRDPIAAATLHPHKLPGWIAARAAAGWPTPVERWCHYRAKGNPAGVTHIAQDWSGSSGLFAVNVARQKRVERVILCGVPMSPEAGHVTRGIPWDQAFRYKKGWTDHMHEIRYLVRSMSGWTAAMLGTPDLDWLEPN